MGRTVHPARPAPVLLAGLLLVLALILAACGTDAEESPGDDEATDDAGAEETTEEETDDEGEAAADEPADLREVTFLLPSDNPVQYYPFYVAQDQGYFEEEGLSVTIENADGSSAVIQQVLAGNAEIGLPSPPAYLNAVARDQDVRWIYQLQYTNVFDLAAPVDSGITSIADLDGRNVGVSELSGGEVPFVRAVLGAEGLIEGQNVNLVPIGEGGALTFEALESGQVEAYSSSVFDIATLAAAGLETQSLLPDNFRFFPANGVVVTADTLDSDREMLIGFLRAVSKGIVFGETNPDAGRDIAVAAAPELYDDEQITEAFWDATGQLFARPPEVEGEPLGTPYREGWQEFHDFISEGTEEEGALPSPVDLDVALDESLLSEAADFDQDEVSSEAEAYGG